MGIKDFEDRRDNIMNKIFSTLDNPKVKEKKKETEKEDIQYLSNILPNYFFNIVYFLFILLNT